MAKKFVRGITDIKTINNQDFDTNNVNDLLSDGKHNYIHRKKQDGSEEYHNLTNNIKTIQSDDTDLLTVTNYNNTTNSATIRPKHDSQKEQLLESTDESILIEHGENGTEETTSVDVNPKIVLEHNNLISTSEYITIEHEDESNTSVISTDVLNSEISTLKDKTSFIGGRNLLAKTNQGKTNWGWTVSDGQTTAEDYNVDGINSVKLTRSSGDTPSWSYIQYRGLVRKIIEPSTKYTLTFDVNPSQDVTFTARLVVTTNVGLVSLSNRVTMNQALANNWTKVSCILTTNETLPDDLPKIVNLEGMTTENGSSVIFKNLKLEKGSISSDWTPAPEDVDDLLAQKQNTLTSNASIGVSGNGLIQLYSYKMTYSNPLEGSLNTYAKTVQKDTTLTANTKLEYHFTVLLKDGVGGMSVDLEDDDVTYFTCILNSYGRASGSTKDAMINGLLFTLNGSRLTVSRTGSTYNQVVSFCDIIDPSQDTTQ